MSRPVGLGVRVTQVLRVGSIVFRVDDLARQVEFRSAALGDERRVAHDDDFVLLRPRDGVGPNVSLDRVRPTVQVPPRIHLTGSRHPRSVRSALGSRGSRWWDKDRSRCAGFDRAGSHVVDAAAPDP